MDLSPSMARFSEFIGGHGLVDPPLTGGAFTWSNNRPLGPSFASVFVFFELSRGVPFHGSVAALSVAF